MDTRESIKRVLSEITKISNSQKALLNDEFFRLSYISKYERNVSEIISQVRDISRIEYELMTSKKVSYKELMNDIVEKKKEFNNKIDDVIKELKTIFNNLLSSADIKSARKKLLAHKKIIDKYQMVELHDYNRMMRVLNALDRMKDSSSERDNFLEEERKIQKCLERIREDLESEREIESVEDEVAKTLTHFEELIEEQTRLVKIQIRLLSWLKLNPKAIITKNGKLPAEFSSRINILVQTSSQLRSNLMEEKSDVFDVLNLFMKKRRDASSVLEYVFDNSSSENLLGVRDVTTLLSTMHSIDDAFDLLLTLMDFMSLFSTRAQDMIKKEMENYRRLVKSTKKDARLAWIDMLTNTSNKRAFTEKMRVLKAESPKNLSVIFFDIDFFKTINDVYGHEAGDVILRNVADKVKSVLRRGTDSLFRVGGEEFIITLKDTSLANATKVANKLNHIIETTDFGEFAVESEKNRKQFWEDGRLRLVKDKSVFWYSPKEKKIHIFKRKDPKNPIEKIDGPGDLDLAKKDNQEQPLITISVGVSSSPENSNSFDSLVKLADQCAYISKQSGRNKVTICKKS